MLSGVLGAHRWLPVMLVGQSGSVFLLKTGSVFLLGSRYPVRFNTLPVLRGRRKAKAEQKSQASRAHLWEKPTEIFQKFQGWARLKEKKIGVKINPLNNYPIVLRHQRGVPTEQFCDVIECMIGVTAHEVAHLKRWDGGIWESWVQGKRDSRCEQETELLACFVLRQFCAGRGASWRHGENREAARLFPPSHTRASMFKIRQGERTDGCRNGGFH